MIERHGLSGFTLLELVFAMALFAVGLLGLTMMTSGLMSNNAAAHRRAIATQLGQNKLETLRGYDYSEISGSLELNMDASDNSGGGIFRREVAVEEKAAPVCKEVTVTVSWEAKGEHEVVLKTVFAP